MASQSLLLCIFTVLGSALYFAKAFTLIANGRHQTKLAGQSCCKPRSSISMAKDQMVPALSRRNFMQKVAVASSIPLLSTPSLTSAAAKSNPELAKKSYDQLIEARKQLEKLEEMIKKNEYLEVVEEIDGPMFSGLGDVMKSLVTSNVLTDEDKVAIGTIRRYGIAADVIITIGGLKAEIMNAADEDDPEEIDVSKLNQKVVLSKLQLGKNSLNEILNICKTYKNIF